MPERAGLFSLGFLAINLQFALVTAIAALFFAFSGYLAHLGIGPATAGFIISADSLAALVIQPVIAPAGIAPLPFLASGAVIPPNAEFAAILGDQRAGRNLEAPEGLLRQIVREEIGRIETDVRISFEGSLGALVRELKPHIDRESVRVGGSLIAGGAR